MPSVMEKVRRYMQSPQGRRNVDKAKKMARDPRTQRKARSWLDRIMGRSTSKQ